MGDVADLSIGAPTPPQVSGAVGDPVLEDPKPKRARSRSTPPPAGAQPGEPAPTGIDMLDDPLPAVTMDQVRQAVMAVGLGLGMLLGDDDVADHWRFTETELAMLVPPLTTVINRRPALRRAVQQSDHLTIAMVLAGYAGRNVDSLRAARKARAQREAEVEGGLEGEARGAEGVDHAPAAGPGRADGRGGGDRGGLPWPAGRGAG